MFKPSFKAITLIGCAVICASIVTVVSCTKKVDTSNYSQFVGEWTISDNCSGFKTPEIKVAAGSNSYSMKVTYKMGYLPPGIGNNYDSCQREITLDAMVNNTAAKDYFSMGNQVVTDNCGNVYQISGGGYIRRASKDNEVDTLIFTTSTYTTGNAKACEFHGYRH